MKKLLFVMVACLSMAFASCGNGNVTPVSDNDSIDTINVDTIENVDTTTVDTVCID